MTEVLRRRDPDRWRNKRLRARQILRWEHGQNEPRGEFVEVMAIATDREIEFFFGDEDEEEAAQMRRHARELLLPLNDSMVAALLAECQARVAVHANEEVPLEAP